MRKLNVMLCSAVFSVAALATSSVAFAAGEADAPAAAPETSSAPAAADQSAAPALTPDAPATPPVQTPQSQNALSGADEQGAAAESQSNPADPYEVKTFFADFKRFTLGDVVPDLYRSKKYIVSDWKTRHLPAPEASSHWTYMGGNYVLITDAEGKILSAKSGEIFYKQ